MWGTWPTFESWTWPGWEGKDITVEVYSRETPVSLFLNDQLVGQQPTKEMKATFTLPYSPGTLRAEAGAAKTTLATAGSPSALRLTADRSLLKANGQDLAFVTVEVVDSNGQGGPIADTKLTFKVAGQGTLLAAGNADIKDEDPYFDATHRAWKGRALCVVRSAGKPGTIRLTVTSDSLKPATLTIKAQ